MTRKNTRNRLRGVAMLLAMGLILTSAGTVGAVEPIESGRPLSSGGSGGEPGLPVVPPGEGGGPPVEMSEKPTETQETHKTQETKGTQETQENQETKETQEPVETDSDKVPEKTEDQEGIKPEESKDSEAELPEETADVVPSYTITVVETTPAVLPEQQTIVETVSVMIPEGDPYEIRIPGKTGYAPTMDSVSGTATEDKTVEVEYVPQNYRETVYYRYLDGSEAAPAFSTVVRYGNTYSVDSPVVAGYSASATRVQGRMPGRDSSQVVYYTRNEEAVKLVDISDYDTPLGLGLVNLNAGDCYE